jgi:RNA polymerase sigma factor (sigma-70 family)
MASRSSPETDSPDVHYPIPPEFTMVTSPSTYIRQLPSRPIDGERLLLDRPYQHQLAQIAHKQTRGSNLAWEDAMQSAQIKVLQAFRDGKFRDGDAAAFYRWASCVARCEIIDLVRKANRECCTSLDQPIGDSDVSWIELVADESNPLENLGQNDLVEWAIAAITTIDQAQPEKYFSKLWQAKLTGKRQTELAAELGMTQSTISKRWKELTYQLELLQPSIWP